MWSDASAAATASLVESGFEAQSTTSAPPALSVSIRFAVSLVTWRHAASFSPLSGCSLVNRARIKLKTGISRAAQSMRSWPCGARLVSLTSCPLVLTFKCLSLVDDLADHFDVGQALSPAQVIELDQALHPDDIAAELVDQTNGGGRGAARRQYIIDYQHPLARLDGVRMDFELVGSVLELIALADRLPGKFSRFSDRYEPGVELDRDGSDEVRRVVAPGLRHHVDDLSEQLLAPKQRRDVAKNDARLRVAGNIAHIPLQLLWRGHTTDRKYSRVRRRPSSRATRGSQPSRLRARLMSGRRCFGSSTGSSLNSMVLLEPARRTIVWARSRTVTSWGLPRLTGSSSARSSAARTPRTRSET